WAEVARGPGRGRLAAWRSRRRGRLPLLYGRRNLAAAPHLPKDVAACPPSPVTAPSSRLPGEAGFLPPTGSSHPARTVDHSTTASLCIVPPRRERQGESVCPDVCSCPFWGPVPC